MSSRIPDNLADIVGGTPLVRFTRIAPDCDAEIIGKLEVVQPGRQREGQDRRGDDRRRRAEGRIEPGRTTIVEATSGNTGIALAFVCAAKGYELVLAMPQGMSRERESLLRLYGAQRGDHRVARRDERGGGGRGPDRRGARRLLHPRPVLEPRQPGDPPPHHGRGDLGGTRTARSTCSWPAWAPAARSPAWGSVLKERNPELHVVAVEPKSSPVLSGGPPGPHKIQGIGAGFVPPVLNREIIDEIMPVDDEDALDMARLLARREGVLAGISVRRGASGRRSRSAAGRSSSGERSWRSCPTRASATCRCRSSRRDHARPDRRRLPDELGAGQARAGADAAGRAARVAARPGRADRERAALGARGRATRCTVERHGRDDRQAHDARRGRARALLAPARPARSGAARPRSGSAAQRDRRRRRRARLAGGDVPRRPPASGGSASWTTTRSSSRTCTRQPLHFTPDIGAHKAEPRPRSCALLNPDGARRAVSGAARRAERRDRS